MAITKEKVLGMLKGLKVDKSPGPDGLHPRVLKEIAEEIVEALVAIFEESLESRRVPEDWKMANATLLLKKGGRQNSGNYRPVSFTLVNDKILKSIIKDEIAEYSEVHELMEAKSFRVFRTDIDRFLIGKGIKGYWEKEEG
eukprot:g36779.t1